MLTYNLTLSGQNLLGADKFSIAAESNESIQLHFYFDKSWRIYDSKAAVFRDHKKNYYVMEILGNHVKVPWEVLRTDAGFDLAVVAYDNALVYTSKRVTVAVSGSLLPEFCKQLSPTETLFDRLRAECKNEAVLEYRDELREIKRSYEMKIHEKEAQIIAERGNTAAVASQKDAIIAQLNYDAECERISFGTQIAALNAELAQKTEQANNWELIDTALSQKTSHSFTLWNGGTEPFDLPMLNTSSITGFSQNTFSTNLRKIGLDLISVRDMQNVFTEKPHLEEVRFKNSENVTTCYNIFSNCRKLIYADLGNLRLCSNFMYAFANCNSLRKVKLGNAERIFDARNMFSDCISLKEIEGALNLTACTNAGNAFANCISLETVRFAENSIRVSISMDRCINLSKESLFSVANGLCDSVSATLSLARSALIKSLTDEEQTELTDIIADKGWTLSLS